MTRPIILTVFFSLAFISDAILLFMDWRKSKDKKAFFRSYKTKYYALWLLLFLVLISNQWK